MTNAISDAELWDKPLAYVEFNEYMSDQTFRQCNGRHFYPVGLIYNYEIDPVHELEFVINVRPAKTHKLAFYYAYNIKNKNGFEMPREMDLTINGKTIRVDQLDVYKGLDFAWHVIPVTNFFTDCDGQEKYHIKIKGVQDPGPMIAEIRLISDEKQLRSKLTEDVENITMITPAYSREESLKKKKADIADEKAFKERLKAQKAFVRDKWAGKTKMSSSEIEKDEFLSAAVKFADTAIAHGRDKYGKEHTPLFSQYLHVEKLEAPRCRPLTDSTSPYPNVVSYFARQQNLHRLLASLSNITGEEKYVEAAFDSTAFMFERYWAKRSGLFAWGGHLFVDLLTDRPYGTKGATYEIEVEFPFWEFILDVDPVRGEKTVCGTWLSFLGTGSWNHFMYNRHGRLDHPVDVNNFWDREYEQSDAIIAPGNLYGNTYGFNVVAHDMTYAASCLSACTKQEKPLVWAERMYDYISRQRDPRTKIWPRLANPITDRGWKSKDASATYGDVYVDGFISGLPQHLYGILNTIEVAKNSGFAERVVQLHKAYEEYVIGLFDASYNHDAGRFRSIIADGTDISGSSGNKGGTAPSAMFFSVVAKSFRLSESKVRKEKLWNILRAFFEGKKELGQIGATPHDEPDFNYDTKNAEPCILFCILDLYRATGKKEYLKFAEHVGRNILKYRQHKKSGLFTLPNVQEILGKKHEIASIDEIEPLALLSLHVARTDQWEKMPPYAGSSGVWGGERHAVGASFENWFLGKEVLLKQWKNYMHGDKNILELMGFDLDNLGPEWFPEE